MKHYVIELTYRVPLERLDQSTPAHRSHIQTGVDQGLILCSGPRVPREGGIIIGRADSQASLEAFFALDPYLREGLADYRYLEFQPLRYQAMLAGWAGQD